MNLDQNATKESEDSKSGSASNSPVSMTDHLLDPELQSTLRNFRLSVHAWSEAAYNRPRPAVWATPHQRAWRRATAWALGCVLALGVAAGGVHEHQQQSARAAAAREAENQRQLADQHALDAEDLLAKVDSEISRQVPNAMEPLAQLMVEDEGK
jgi:uncharacterized protein HemX